DPTATPAPRRPPLVPDLVGHLPSRRRRRQPGDRRLPPREPPVARELHGVPLVPRRLLPLFLAACTSRAENAPVEVRLAIDPATCSLSPDVLPLDFAEAGIRVTGGGP